jgi:hypothetical protein
MPSSTSSSDAPAHLHPERENPGITRQVPTRPWSAMAVVAAVMVVAVAGAWEWHCRAIGYAPGLNDTTDLWCDARRHVEPDSVVIVGASRALFDLDLDTLQTAFGKRPVQLALVGTCAYPELRDLADDQSFHGTVICDVVPGLITIPTMAPPYLNAEKALKRLHTQTWSQRFSFHLSMGLEQSFACLQQEDLTMTALLGHWQLPNRERTQLPPALPPCFSTIDRDRRTRMLPSVLTDHTLQDRVKFGWPPLFTPPPKPSWIPDAAFADFMGKMFNQRFTDIAKAVADIRARGGKVIFIREPSSGPLLELEDKLTPRAVVWDRILRESGAPGIYFQDFPQLAGFTCPEWSHLSADDSVAFTKALAPLLVQSLDPSALRKTWQGRLDADGRQVADELSSAGLNGTSPAAIAAPATAPSACAARTAP